MPAKCRTFSDPLTRERVERAARMYHSNIDAAVALGCTRRALGGRVKSTGLRHRRNDAEPCGYVSSPSPIRQMARTTSVR